MMSTSRPLRGIGLLVRALLLLLFGQTTAAISASENNVTASANGAPGSDPAPIGPAECVAGFKALTSAGFVFTFERYPEIFRDDSALVFAQAGTYRGPERIEEYVRFATPTSPYFSGFGAGPWVEGLRGIDGDVCVFSRVASTTYVFDEAVAGDRIAANITTLSHFYYDAVEDYVTRWNVYYTAPALDLFFGTALNTPRARDFVCGVMENACGHDVDSSSGGCQERLGSLPPTTGEDVYFDGDSQGCRVLHAVFARTNPDGHCPHIAFDPTPDADGKVKCQESEGIDPLELFGADDIAALGDFCEANGIDPALGYALVETTAEEDDIPTGPTDEEIIEMLRERKRDEAVESHAETRADSESEHTAEGRSGAASSWSLCGRQFLLRIALLSLAALAFL